MQYLEVPFKDKDKAKQLGARWNAEKKSWYVPDEVQITAFEKWLPKLSGANSINSNPPASATPRIKAVAKSDDDSKTDWPTNVGEKFFAIDHDCIPWEYCETCSKDPRMVGF
jgi:hypothetical protein